MKPIQVGLLGIGTVGSGTFAVLSRNQEEIRRRAGRGIEIAMVADLDTVRAEKIVAGRAKVVADARAVIADKSIDIVVELIGGYGIAKTLVLEAIAAGKHVVTANKALLAVHGNEIFAAAPAIAIGLGSDAVPPPLMGDLVSEEEARDIVERRRVVLERAAHQRRPLLQDHKPGR